MANGEKRGTVGIIARFKPLHNGAARMLDYTLHFADHAVIGIGSSNKYNARNPFTPQETREILDAYLKPCFKNYEIVEVPDFAHDPLYENGQKWTEFVVDKFKVSAFVTANEYVTTLLAPHYNIIHPAHLIPKDKWVQLRATKVRHALANDENWQRYVPKEVAAYMTAHKLDERFKKEFGLETLEKNKGKNFELEDCLAERLHTLEK